MARKQMYRSQALRAMESSHEEIERLLPVTSWRLWLAAVAAGLLVLAGLLYAAADSRTVTVAGDGRSRTVRGAPGQFQRRRSVDVLRRRTRPDGRQGSGGRLRPVRRRADRAAHRQTPAE